MELKKLIEEYTDCHDKERRRFLRAEIEKRAQEHILKCYDIVVGSR